MDFSAPVFDPFRRFGAGVGYDVPKNYWYRVWLAITRNILCIIDCEQLTETTEPLVVTTTIEDLREKRQYAKKTVVSNLGSDTASIYELARLVAIVAPGETKTLPRTGKFALSGHAHSTTTTLKVTTFVRCACGEDYEESADSIGTHLL